MSPWHHTITVEASPTRGSLPNPSTGQTPEPIGSALTPSRPAPGARGLGYVPPAGRGIARPVPLVLLTPPMARGVLPRPFRVGRGQVRHDQLLNHARLVGGREFLTPGPPPVDLLHQPAFRLR